MLIAAVQVRELFEFAARILKHAQSQCGYSRKFALLLRKQRVVFVYTMSVTFPAWKNPISKDLYFLDMREGIHSSSPSFKKFNIQRTPNLTVHLLTTLTVVAMRTFHCVVYEL